MERKELFLIRHGKANQWSKDNSDFARQLHEKGRDRILRIAKELQAFLDPLDKITLISSPAYRAKETAILFAQTLGFPVASIVYYDEIYERGENEILQVINNQAATSTQILLFGHNNPISDLASWLCNERVYLRTTGIAHIACDLPSWEMLSGGTATLKQIL